MRKYIIKPIINEMLALKNYKLYFLIRCNNVILKAFRRSMKPCFHTLHILDILIAIKQYGLRINITIYVCGLHNKNTLIALRTIETEPLKIQVNFSIPSQLLL